jgi:hypothetical protein
MSKAWIIHGRRVHDHGHSDFQQDVNPEPRPRPAPDRPPQCRRLATLSPTECVCSSPRESDRRSASRSHALWHAPRRRSACAGTSPGHQADKAPHRRDSRCHKRRGWDAHARRRQEYLRVLNFDLTGATTQRNSSARSPPVLVCCENKFFTRCIAQSAKRCYSARLLQVGSVAQSVEQRTFNPLVPSSNLGRPTKKRFRGVSSVGRAADS